MVHLDFTSVSILNVFGGGGLFNAKDLIVLLFGGNGTVLSQSGETSLNHELLINFKAGSSKHF